MKNGKHYLNLKLILKGKKMKLKDFKIHNRVQLHPATDTWMRGDKYGEVIKIGTKLIHLKMDSGKVIKISPSIIWEIVS
jgi:hypothetical protein